LRKTHIRCMARLPNTVGGKFLASLRHSNGALMRADPEGAKCATNRRDRCSVMSRRYTSPRPRFAATEMKLADSAKDHVEVTIKMPTRLHEHLASICARSDVKLDDIVCEQIERWLLRQAITRLEAPEEDKAGSTSGASEG
jgi:hypothetical protein